MDDDLLCFEDFPVGEVAEFGHLEVTADEIKSFAEEFDPLPFHTDEAAAEASVMGGLCASGWHVVALLMRMCCEGYVLRTASMGSNGVDEVKWRKPVRPGDVLSVRRTTLAARVSRKRPEMGIVTFLWEIVNQTGATAAEVRGVNLVATRASREASSEAGHA